MITLTKKLIITRMLKTLPKIELLCVAGDQPAQSTRRRNPIRVDNPAVSPRAASPSIVRPLDDAALSNTRPEFLHRRANRRSLGLVTLPCFYSLQLCFPGSAVQYMLPSHAVAREISPFSPLIESLEQIRDATRELEAMQDSLCTSAALGTSPPLQDLKLRLRSKPLLDLTSAAQKIDKYIDIVPLDNWEEVIWMSMEDDRYGYRSDRKMSARRLPGIERPNDFLCFLFSCFNDPRAPPSTNMLLSLKLLEDGVDMGIRGDRRINAEGLSSSVSDVKEKLEAYLTFLESLNVAIPDPTAR